MVLLNEGVDDNFELLAAGPGVVAASPPPPRRSSRGVARPRTASRHDQKPLIAELESIEQAQKKLHGEKIQKRDRSTDAEENASRGERPLIYMHCE
jgi:hypothetical protein